MGTELGDVYAAFGWKLKGVDDVVKNIKEVGQRADEAGDSAERGFKKAQSPLKDFGKDLVSIIRNLAGFGLAVQGIKAIGQAFGWVANRVIDANAEFERYQTQLSVLLGGVDAATERIEKLGQFGRETPFELPGIIRAEKILLAFGLAADDAREKFGYNADEIRVIAGDVAAGTGQQFEAIANYVGRFAAGSTGEAIMRFQELGIVTRKELAGVGVEFSTAGQMMSPLEDATEALLKLMQDKFGGMMDAQSATFEGMQSNLQDWWWEARRIASEPIFDVAKEKLGELLSYLDRPETQKAIELFSKRLAESLGRIVENVTKLVGWLARLDPETIKVALGFTAIGVALPKVIAGIAAVKTGFVGLSALIAANPLGLAAMAIVAAGLGIAAVVQKMRDEEKRLRSEMAETSDEILKSTQSYEQYQAAMVSTLREQRRIPTHVTNQAVAMGGLRDGLMMTEDQWRTHAALLNKEVGPALGGLDEGILSVGRSLGHLEHNVSNVAPTLTERFQGISDGFLDMRQRIEESEGRIQGALVAAFRSDEVVAEISKLGTMASKLTDDLLKIEQQHGDRVKELQFQNQMERVEAEAEYQAQRKTLLEAGRTEEIADLDQKFSLEEGQASSNYDKQRALLERNLIMQKIQRQRAYIEELKGQGDQIRKTLINQIKKISAKGNLSAEAEKTLIGIVMAGSSERLKNEVEYAKRSGEIDKLIADNKIGSAQIAIEALLALQQTDLAAAEDALDALQSQFDQFSNELLSGLTSSGAGAFDGFGGAFAAGAEEASESATKALADVSRDIEASIQAMLSAIEQLEDVEIPETVDASFAKLGEFFHKAVDKFYSWYERDKDRLDEVADVAGPIQKLGSALQSLGGATGAIADMKLPDTSQIDTYFQRLEYVGVKIMDWLKGRSEEVRKQVKDAADLAEDIKRLYSVLGIDLAKAINPGDIDDYEEKATTYVNRLEFMGKRLMDWMRKIRPEWRKMLKDAAPVAEDQKKLFGILTVDVTKSLNIANVYDFESKTRIMTSRLEYVGKRLMDWIGRIKVEWREMLEKAVPVAENIKKLFGVLDIDFSNVADVQSPLRFASKLFVYLEYMKWSAGEIRDWLAGQSQEMKDKVKEAAKLAKDYKTLFELFSFDTSRVQDVKETFPELMANWIDRVSAGIDRIMPKLVLLRAKWGDQFAAAQEALTGVAGLFASIQQIAQSVAAANESGGLELAGIERLFGQAGELGNYLAGMPPAVPALAGLGAGGGAVTISLNFGDVYVRDGNEFIDTISDRLSDLRQPLRDMGLLAAGKGLTP